MGWLRLRAARGWPQLPTVLCSVSGDSQKNMGTRSIFYGISLERPFSVETGSVGGFVALMFFNRSCNQQGPGGSVCCQMDGVFLAVAIWVTATVPLRLSKHSTMMRQESQRRRNRALSRSGWWHPPCLEKHGLVSFLSLPGLPFFGPFVGHLF